MAPKPTLAELREKKKENEAYLNKIIQRTNALGNSIRAQEKNLTMYDRKERTHRLCTRGGMLESFLRDPNALPIEVPKEQYPDMVRERGCSYPTLCSNYYPMWRKPSGSSSENGKRKELPGRKPVECDLELCPRKGHRSTHRASRRGKPELFQQEWQSNDAEYPTKPF